MLNKGLWITLLALVLGYLAVNHMTNLRSYAGLTTAQLVTTERELAIHVSLANTNPGSESQPLGETQQQELTKAKSELIRARLELALRNYFVDPLVYGIGILSMLMLAATLLQSRGRKLPKNRDALIREMSVQEDAPKEEYLDEWNFERRIQEGFKTREEAIKWLKSDPYLTCGYCGGTMRSTYTGQRESIYLITFYKPVPAGAKDMRVVLGSYWFTRSASDLVCSRCGRAEKR